MPEAEPTVDAYISGFSGEVKDRLQKIRKVIKETAPKAQEKISYNMPTYKQGRNLVHFAGFKNHIGFFPSPSGIEAFRDELTEYETSKGTIRFPHDKPIPYELIKKIVQYRVHEEESRKYPRKED